MSRARFTPALIEALTGRVIAHNEQVLEKKVGLGRLKKAIADNWRGSDPETTGLRAVDRLLENLRKADPGFDPAEHPRDANGRFTGGAGRGAGGAGGGRRPPSPPPASPPPPPPGGGQRGFYGDVARRQEHEQLRDENAGYAANQQAVIPETRWTDLYPYVGFGAGMLAGATGGAFPGAAARRDAAIGRGAGAVAGAVTNPLSIGAGYAATRMEERTRRTMGHAARSDDDLADLARARGAMVRGKIKAGVTATVRGAGWVLNAPAIAINNAAEADIKQRGLTGARKVLRRARGRIAGAAVGALVPGIIAGATIKGGMDMVGPLLNAAFPRRVDKSTPGGPMHIEVAAAEEALAKWSLSSAASGVRRLTGSAMAGLRGAMRRQPPVVAPKPVKPLTAAEARAAKTAKLNRIGGRAASRLMNPERIRTFGHTLAAAGGAAALGGAAAGATYAAQRVYYRDEDGKFTSKERAVAPGTAAAVGAVAGALAGLALTHGKNRTLARELSEKISASRKQIIDTAGNKAALRAEGKAGPSVAKAREAAAKEFDGWKAAASSDDPVQWTHWSIDRRADDKITDLLGSRSFRASHPEGRSRDLPKLKAEEAKIAGSTDKATVSRRNKLRAEISEIEGAVAGRSAAEAAYKAEVTAWEQGGRKDTRPRALRGWLEAAREDRAAGRADWKRHLHPSQRAQVESIEATAAKAKADYSTQVGSLKSGLDEAKQNLTAHQARHTELEAQIKEKEAQVSPLKTRRQALKAAKEPAEIAERKDLADKIKDMEDEQLNLIKERDALSPLIEKENARVADATSRLNNKQPKSDTAPAFPRAPDPFDPKGGFIPAKPTDDQLEAIRQGIETRYLGRSEETMAQAQAKARVHAAEVADATVRALQNRGTPPKGAVGQSISRVSSVLGPRIANMKADARRVGGVVSAAMGPAGGNLVTYARTAGQKGWEAGKNTASWAIKNPVKAVGFVTTAGVAFGFADVSDDGSVNLSLVRGGADAGKSMVQVARERVHPVHKLYNPGTDRQVIIVGAVVEQPDGKKLFVHGTRTVGNGKPQPIPTGAELDEVLKNARSGNFNSGNSNNNSRPVEKTTFGAPDQQGKWEKTVEQVRGAGGLEDWGDGDDAFQHRSTQQVQGRDKAADGQMAAEVRAAIYDEAAKAKKKGGPYGGFGAPDWYAHASRIFDNGGGTEMMPLGWRAALILGEATSGNTPPRPGLLPASQSAAIESAWAKKDRTAWTSALRKAIEDAPSWKEGQDRQLRRVVGVLNDRAPGDLRLTSAETEQMYRIIAGKQYGGGGQAAGAAAPPPPPPPPPEAGGRRAASATDLAARARVEHLSNATETIAKAMNKHPSAPQFGEAIETIFVKKAELLRQSKPDLEADHDAFWRQVRDHTVHTATRKVTKAAIVGELRKAEGWALGRLAKAAEPRPPTPPRGLPGDAPRTSSRGIAGQLASKSRSYDDSKHSRQPSGSDRGGEFAPRGAGGGAGAGVQAARAANPRRQPAAQAAAEPPRDDRSYFEPVRLGGAVGGAVAGQLGWEIAERVLPGPLKTVAVGARLAQRLASALGPRALGRAVGRLGISGAAGIAGAVAGEGLGANAYAAGRAPGSYAPDTTLGEDAARFGGSLAGGIAAATRGGGLAGRLAYGTAGSLGGEEIAAAAHEVISRRFGGGPR